MRLVRKRRRRQPGPETMRTGVDYLTGRGGGAKGRRRRRISRESSSSGRSGMVTSFLHRVGRDNLS
jgi:hypothetical protein